MSTPRTDHPFSLTRGGPFYHLLHSIRLVDRDGKIRWLLLVSIAWLPLVVDAIAQLAFGRGLDSTLRDVPMHVRILVTLPLLVFAEHLLETRCQTAARYVHEEGIVQCADLDAILDRTERLRDSRLVEGALAVGILGSGQASLWGLTSWSSLVHPLEHSMVMSFANIWCTAIVIPLVQFMVLRWLWRWLLWAYVLARLSRLPLSLNAIHPDQAAGLKILSIPIDAFALYVAAYASIAAVDWMVKVHDHRATLETISAIFFAFVLAAIVLACSPLLVFFRDLYRARLRDTTAYHALAREYVDEFRRKWITGRADASPVLGTSDIQSLNDLIGSYEATDSTRLYPFGVRDIINVCAGALVPMVPLVFTVASVSKVAAQLGKMLFGRFI